MKKRYIIPLILLLASCNNNVSSSTTSSSYEEVSSSESSSFVPYSEELVTVDADISDFEIVYDEEKQGYMIEHYYKYEASVRFPSTYEGQPIIGINRAALISSGGVKDLYLPASYRYLHGEAFKGLTTLMNIYIDEASEYFTTINGALYSKDGKTLIAGPLGRSEYTVVDGTETIAENAFDTSLRVKKVILPESISRIGAYAFFQCKNLMEINIPSKVTEIEERTFSDCYELRSLNGLENVTSIGVYAYYQCHSLIDVKIPANVEIIQPNAFESCNKIRSLSFGDKIHTIAERAFSYCEMIENLSFPSSLRTIGRYAFLQNFRILNLVLNEGLEYIDEGAFYYFTALRTVSLPSTLQDIGYDAFTSSVATIRSITVSEDSPYLTVYDGVVYTKDYRRLIFRAPRFDSETNEHVIKEGCEIIESNAFYNSISLASVTLPSTLKTIKMTPFFLCGKLRNVSYNGTMEQFNAIKKLDRVEVASDYSSKLTYHWNATYSMDISEVHCNDGTVKVPNSTELEYSA